MMSKCGGEGRSITIMWGELDHHIGLDHFTIPSPPPSTLILWPPIIGHRYVDRHLNN